MSSLCLDMRHLLAWLFGMLALATTAGCTAPAYPACRGDVDCRQTGRPPGFCVANYCVQCRQDSHCTELYGPNFACNGGACTVIEDYCSPPGFVCPGDEICRNERCECDCRSDDECAEGHRCENCRCEALPGCIADADCPYRHLCAPDGSCVPAPVVPGQTVCEDSAQCPQGQFCQDLVCVEGCECQGDDQCTFPALCMDCQCVGGEVLPAPPEALDDVGGDGQP